MVQKGDRIKMTGVMPNDPDPVPVGTEGTVTGVSHDVGQIYVDWDEDADGNARSLILLTSDPFRVLI